MIGRMLSLGNDMERESKARERIFEVSELDIQKWLSEENLQQRSRREFQGFELVDALDGGKYPEREVTLVSIKRPGEYPQHVHKDSDAIFFITLGSAVLLSGSERKELKKGDRIEVPRGMPHGFETIEGETFSFVSIQSPPIKNRETGDEDFHLIEIV